jgi:hypothetical protein
MLLMINLLIWIYFMLFILIYIEYSNWINKILLLTKIKLSLSVSNLKCKSLK